LQTEFKDLVQEHSAATTAASRQTDSLKLLEARLAELESRAAAQENLLTERDVQVVTLQRDLEQLRTQAGELGTELEESRKHSQSLASELHAREAAVITLRSELAAHVEALGAIRRDITLIESGKSGDGGPQPVRYLIAVDSADVVHVLNRKVMTIGRTPESDLQIRSNHVSRHHARLLVGPNAVILEDLDSTNGCFVNGRRIRKQVLHKDDILMIGKTRYRFAIRTAPDSSTH